MSRTRALLLFLATTLIGSTLGRAWVDPRTTTLSAALIWLALTTLCQAHDETLPPAGVWQSLMTGVLLAAIPLCRPGDLVVSALIGAALAFRTLRPPGGWRPAAERRCQAGDGESRQPRVAALLRRQNRTRYWDAHAAAKTPRWP